MVFLCAREDSNPEPPGPKPGTLSIELRAREYVYKIRILCGKVKSVCEMAACVFKLIYMREAMRMPEKIKIPEKIEAPQEVLSIMNALKERGFSAYIVGGCLRDILLQRDPKDWDIATDAKPEQIQELFTDSVYENEFGTVGVKTESENKALKIIEVTTFRTEGEYSDKRHPDAVEFTDSIEQDLARRDFTINAMAWDGAHFVDPFGGQKDLGEGIIRTVGDPDRRFSEDALRLMRAVRFSSDLSFVIENGTSEAMRKNAGLLEFVAKERIGDEFRRLVMTPSPDAGIETMRELKMLKHVLPELEEGWDVEQNKHHIFTVWEHNIRALRYTVEQKYPLEVRMAALLHDVGKPRAKRGSGPDATFWGHEVVGGRLAAEALERLHFSKKEIEKIALLVRSHMFQYDPDIVTDASVRRLIAKVGAENMKELIQVREADRVGSGVKKAVPYRLRHFMFKIEKLLTESVSRKDMKIDGVVLMNTLGVAPGLRVGAILEALFEEILDEPGKNDTEYLVRRAHELNELSDTELAALRQQAKEKYEAVLREEEEAIKSKYQV